MLEPPDFYKKFDELISEKVQQDIENDLIPEHSNFDLRHAEKISKKKYMEVIERLIKHCHINNDYEKHEKELQEYAQTYIDKNYPFHPKTMLNLVMNYKLNEFESMINPSLQAFVLYVELIRQLYFYLQEKYIRKEKDTKLILVHYFVQYSLELLNGICSLLLGGNHNIVISVYRTFYENYIIFNYLQKHEELINAFLEHTTIDNCIISMEFSKLHKLEIPDDIQKKYNDLISKYGEDFKDDYGWTSSVISKKNERKLKTLFEESDLGNSFNFYYKLSCKYSHSTAFSLMVRPNFYQLYGFLFEIADIIDKEFEVLFSKICLASKKEKVLLENWLAVATDKMRKQFEKELSFSTGQNYENL